MNFPHLFSPVQIGPYQLKHRLALAPLTRMRAAKPSLSPRPLNAEYYAQRATPGGLLIAEASPVMETGFGSPRRTPKTAARAPPPGGLLIAEASPVMETGFGSPGVPGIYTEQQIAGWREVVDAVHAKGGVIFLQLWHVGRGSNPDLPRRLQRGFPLTPYDRRPSTAA